MADAAQGAKGTSRADAGSSDPGHLPGPACQARILQGDAVLPVQAASFVLIRLLKP